MKKILITLALGASFTMAQAQTLNVVQGDVTYAIPALQAGEMTYTNGTALDILGKSFNLSEIDRIFTDATEVTDNTVTVTYEGSSAKVVVAGNIARYITPTVEGAHVSLIQSAEVGESTCGEIIYVLSGTSQDGSFYMEGSYKASLELRGLTLTSSQGAPINIQNGKRIELSSKNGTVNSLTDCASGTQKGCIVCKGHLELKGKGQLDITGNTAHAIYAKEYVEMKNCTVNILASQKDGINCSQYFLMESGALNIKGVADDGIQVDYKDTVDREPEDTGSFTMTGGTINVANTGIAVKGIKTEGNITLSGGEIIASSTGNGKWDSSKSKTKAAACIGADGNITINGSTLNLTASGSGGKGITCDGELFIEDGGNITISTSGGVFAYVNGREYHGYTGNTDGISSDLKSSPKGIKADSGITINGGDINVTTTGNGAEGIESKKLLTINDGKIYVKAYDDAINSSSHMYINGGEITVISTNNDGLDANGNVVLNGGYVLAFGGSSPECGIDANSEEGYTVIFTGGTLLGVGGGNSTPTNSQSTQPYVSGSASVSANTTITLKNGNTELASFTVPAGYTSSGGGGGWGGGWGPGGGMGGGNSVLVTCPGLTSGSSYTLTCGSSSSNVTATLYGSGGGGGRPW